LQLFFLAVSKNISGLNAAINNSLRSRVFGKSPVGAGQVTGNPVSEEVNCYFSGAMGVRECHRPPYNFWSKWSSHVNPGIACSAAAMALASVISSDPRPILVPFRAMTTLKHSPSSLSFSGSPE
jgi:hypothetical protein